MRNNLLSLTKVQVSTDKYCKIILFSSDITFELPSTVCIKYIIDF